MDYYMVSVIFISALIGALIGLYLGLSIQNFFLHRKFKKLKKASKKEALRLYPNENRPKGRKKRTLRALIKMEEKRRKKNQLTQADDEWDDPETPEHAGSDTDADTPYGSHGSGSTLLGFIHHLTGTEGGRKHSSLSRLDNEAEGYISEKCSGDGEDVQATVSRSLGTQDGSYAVKRRDKRGDASVSRLKETLDSVAPKPREEAAASNAERDSRKMPNTQEETAPPVKHEPESKPQTLPREAEPVMAKKEETPEETQAEEPKAAPIQEPEEPVFEMPSLDEPEEPEEPEMPEGLDLD